MVSGTEPFRGFFCQIRGEETTLANRSWRSIHPPAAVLREFPPGGRPYLRPMSKKQTASYNGSHPSKVVAFNNHMSTVASVDEHSSQGDHHVPPSSTEIDAKAKARQKAKRRERTFAKKFAAKRSELESHMVVAARRLAILQEMDELRLSSEQMAEHLKATRQKKEWFDKATLARWTVMRNEAIAARTSQLDALRPKFSDRGRKSVIEDGPALVILAEKRMNSKISATELLRLVQNHEKLQHCRKFSIYTLRAFLKSLPSALVSGDIDLRKELFEECGLKVPRPLGGNANDQWDSDEYDTKMRVRDVDTGELFTPHLLVTIDHVFGAIVDILPLRKASDSNDWALAIKRAVHPKSDRASGIFGKPRVWLTDNGGIFRSDDALRALSRLNIEPKNTPSRSPSANGAAERTNRRIGEELGAKFCDYVRKATLAAEYEEFIPSWDEFLHCLKAFIHEFNQKRTHRRHGMPPLFAWKQSAAGMNQTLFHVDADHVNESVLCTTERKVCALGAEIGVPKENSVGIKFAEYRHFVSPALQRLKGKTIRICHPPEGPGTTVEAFVGNRPIGVLRCIEAEPGIAPQMRECYAKGRSEMGKVAITLENGYSRLKDKPSRAKVESTRKRSKRAEKKPGEARGKSTSHASAVVEDIVVSEVTKGEI